MSETTLPSPELKENKNPDRVGLVILGRNIELGKPFGKPRWRPTSLIAKMDRPGLRQSDLKKEDEEAMIGGANANVIAAAQIIEEMAQNGQKPEIVIAAAGRPPYLQRFLKEYSNLSEGKILFERLSRKINLEQIPHEILEDNIDSVDDIIVAHQRALDLGLNKLVFVTVKVHAPRVRDLVDLAKALNPKYEDVKTEVLEAESILERRSKHHKRVLNQELNSPAYKKTWQRELNGRRQLREGTYNFKSKNELLKKYPEILQSGRQIFTQPL